MDNIAKLFSIPKSLFWNMKWYGIKGLKLPILIHYNTKIIIKGKIQLPVVGKPFSSKIGFGGSDGILSYNKQFLYVAEDAQLIFGGTFILSEGSSIRVEKRGEVYIGGQFYANKNFMLSCDSSIEIGDDFVSGWNVHVRDSDGHTIVIDGYDKLNTKNVFIGNHVWVAAEAHILKGAYISDGSVVGYRSTVLGVFNEANCLIAGSPAKNIETNILWKI